MTSTFPPSRADLLDEAVSQAAQALAEEGVPKPQALFLLATGAGSLADSMLGCHELELGSTGVLPAPWSEATLLAGRLGRLDAWVLDDLSLEPLEPEAPAWVAALPVWLAAASGASLCVHASAGTALASPDPGEERNGAPFLQPGAFALVRDHIGLTFQNPLVGVGPSALGPLFPDTSTLHHLGLRHAALAKAAELGLPVAEAVAACFPGPTLETPAEHRMAARLGAEVAVQGLATPLQAAAHAGLSVLSLVAIVDAAPDACADPVRLVERAAELQPRIESFLVALAEDLAFAHEALSASDGGHGR